MASVRQPSQGEETNTYNYAPFYNDIAVYPELGRFRRFSAFWAKKLYDDTQEVLLNVDAIHKELGQRRTSESGVTVLDIPRSIVREKYPDIYCKQWAEYEKSLLQYGETLSLSAQISGMKYHAQYMTDRMGSWDIFEDSSAGTKSRFGPTGEPAATYTGPSHETDTCAWKTLPDGDVFTLFFVRRLSKWFEQVILRRIRSPRIQLSQPRVRTHINHDSIIRLMDIATCVFVPILLDAAMFALAIISPLKARIAIVGVFGLAFALSVKLMAGQPSRSEVFSTTAAFFAVASVFVGSVGDNSTK